MAKKRGSPPSPEAPGARSPSPAKSPEPDARRNDPVAAQQRYDPPTISELPSFSRGAAPAEEPPEEPAEEANAELDDSFSDVDDSMPVRKRRGRRGTEPKADKPATKRKSKKARRESDSDEEAAERGPSELDALISSALKSGNRGARRRGTQVDGDVATQVAGRIIGRMRRAADADRDAFARKQPGTAKLAALEAVKTDLLRAPLWDVLLDEGILNAISDWLKPLDDGSLPTLEVRQTMLDILEQLPIDTDALRESDLGRVLYFYCRCKLELPALQRRVQALVNALVHRVLNRAEQFRYRYTQAGSGASEAATASGDAGPRRPPQRPQPSADGEEAVRFVRMPRATPIHFQVVPQSQVAEGPARARGESQHRRLKQAMQASGGRSRR